MQSILFIGVLSLVLSLVATPLVRDLFLRFGLVDHPDADRKLHRRAVPRVGGIAIALAYLLSFQILLCTHTGGATVIRGALPLIYRVLPGAAIVLLTGVIDDIFGLRPYQKLIGQTLAAFLVYAAGIRITSIVGMSDVHTGAWWPCPVTVIWLLACMNAFNLIDGLDGLAAGLSLVSTATILMVALSQGNIPLVLATAPLAGALFGFLRFNISPATIFLGDCGSLTIGFLLGCFGIVWTTKSATVLGMTAPLIALCVPLIDTALAIGRRFLRNQPIFSPDRGHIHHRLLDLGFSTREVAFALSGAATLAAVLALALAKQEHELILIGMFLLASWIGIQRLNYAEFDVAGRMMAESSFQKMLRARILLEKLEVMLAAAETLDECWALLSSHCRDFGFLEISARLGDRSYLDQAQTNMVRAWRLEIPLNGTDCVWLTRARQLNSAHDVCLPFADLIRRVLEPKLRVLPVLSAPFLGEPDRILSIGS